MCGRDSSGQATVEAAFLLPVLLLIVLLLAQPAILLYDRAVMADAAAEACRLLATAPPGGPDAVDAEAFVRHRLAAVPQHECFHVHEGGCSWRIGLVGNEASPEVRATVATEVRPLPLIGAGAGLLGLVNERGNLTIETTAMLPTQPAWVEDAPAGRDPAAWKGAWADGPHG